MAYPHCCMKGRQEVQWGEYKMRQKHPGYIISVKVLLLCENVNNFHQVCSRLKKIGTLHELENQRDKTGMSKHH